MRTILLLLQKEFLQIRRNRMMLPIIFVMPIMQTLILAFAANYDITDLRLTVVDYDGTDLAKRLVHQLEASDRFVLANYTSSHHAAEEDLQSGHADLYLEIPSQLDRDLTTTCRATLFLGANAINSVKAGVGMQYAASIIADFNQNVRLRYMPAPKTAGSQQIEIVPAEWYNPARSYKNFFVPGILAILITVIGLMLTSLNIVREKEIGTIEQINVTPIHKYQFILGKMIPFLVIGLFDMLLGIMIAKLLFNLPIEGSMILLLTYAALYLTAILGMGLFLSTISETQQQAMFISWFFMIVFLLLGGVFTPIESMPHWAQVVTWFNPASFMVRVLRLVLLKGSNFMELYPYFIKMLGFAIVLNTMAVLNYRKTS